MNRYYKCLIFSIAASLASCGSNQKKHELVVNTNYRSSDLILSFFKTSANRRVFMDSLVKEPGIQIMSENVMLLADPSGDTLRSFEAELMNFNSTDTTSKSFYSTDLAWSERDKSARLLEKLKSEKIENEVLARALAFMPDDYRVATECNIYFVLTGWVWGDAYVVNVERSGEKYSITENEGVPTIVINLSLIAKLYGETAEAQSKVLNGILAHEVFHFAFANYKDQSPQYSFRRDTSVIRKLFDVIHNEGIAHYVDKRSELINGYDSVPKFMEREKTNFEKLNDALGLLAGGHMPLNEQNELLRKASIGKYWSKYGAISGMFMAYHIEKELGVNALKESIKQGPSYFLKQYMAIQKLNDRLPRLDFKAEELLK